MKVKAAVVGVGSMGKNHARIYSDLPEVELVGVADSNPDHAANIAVKYGTKAYEDPLALFESQHPDVITLAVPTVEHHSLALQAIDHGIHLLIEKPISYTIAEGQEIINRAQSAGIKLMVGHIERFNPAVRELKERLTAGELGRVFQIDARREGPFPARIKDVGVVIDLAVHDLDIMRYISGKEIKRLYAETERRIHSYHEDLFAGLVRLADNSIGTLSINWLTPTKIRELTVIGERGMFRVDYLTQDLYFFENATIQSPNWDTLQVIRGVSEGRMIRNTVEKKEPLRSEIEAFVASVREGTEPPVTGKDGLKALELALAVVESGETGKVVEFHR